ncbi:hypothetical protein ACHQM5_002968 [Ranunculus cassubicifolius]
MKWANIDDAREALRDFAIKNNFVYRYVKNEGYRILAKCKNQTCQWRCYIRRMTNKHTMRLATLNPIHTCVPTGSNKNPMANAPWIVGKLEKPMRIHHRSFTPAEVIDYIWLEFQLDILYWQAWHSRSLALEKVHGNYDESYRKVPELCKHVLLSNPGSICSFSRDDRYNTFTSLCVSFKACTDGFIKGCRPLIGLDGCRNSVFPYPFRFRFRIRFHFLSALNL